MRPRDSKDNTEREKLELFTELTAFETFNVPEFTDFMLDVAQLDVILLWSGRSGLM
jgi:hypothetical protein